MFERVPYIIKPTMGMPNRDAIHEIMRASGLSVAENERRIMRIPRWAFESVYPIGKHPSEPPEMWHWRWALIEKGESEVGIVTGEDAVERLLNVVGTSADPRKCAPGTIRRLYGKPAGVTFGKYEAFYKVMHRPENVVEAAHDLLIIEKLLRHS